MTMLDIEDPTGFQHPVQAAYVARDGFDAVIVTIDRYDPQGAEKGRIKGRGD